MQQIFSSPLASKAPIALVLGGTGDIGSAIVRKLVCDGWSVIFTYQNSVVAAKRLEAETSATAIRIRLSDDVLPVFPERLGALVNCVAINPIDSEVSQTSVDVFRAIVETNLVQAFRVAKHALPALIAGQGTIVNISSIWGIRAIEGIVGYVASKHGLRGLTTTLARECGPLGVTCNEVCPGAVESRLLRECTIRDVGSNPTDVEQSIRGIIERTPIRRLVSADEVAASVAFLCSKDARGINGASIVIDGGLTI